MIISKLSSTAPLALALMMALFLAGDAVAACLNRFVVQTQGNKRVVTLLTGEMTFSEAAELARALRSKELAALEWLDAKDRVIATATTFNAVRPMPVACGSRSSGVVVTLELVTFAIPSKSMTLKFPDGTKVTFTEQAK
jgi:hypothetical protein